jgi:hypothetical protein
MSFPLVFRMRFISWSALYESKVRHRIRDELRRRFKVGRWQCWMSQRLRTLASSQAKLLNARGWRS